jgi:CRP/FNR family transcriptional regulator, cyclic AMP receptor protein
MEVNRLLQGVDLFEGLTDEEIEKMTCICFEKQFSKGQIIAREGEVGDELFIISDGFVEVLLGERPNSPARVVVSMGSGQLIGEMALLDQGPRSATLRATSQPTVVQMIRRPDFENLCQQNTHIGYIVMRNLAADLSFKLRLRNLNDR